jgi:hypothetical protein
MGGSLEWERIAAECLALPYVGEEDESFQAPPTKTFTTEDTEAHRRIEPMFVIS